MNEAEHSVWCIENGVYVEQLDKLRQAFECVDHNSKTQDTVKLSLERKRNKKLERELHRKEKALAEMAALLTLSKKTQAI